MGMMRCAVVGFGLLAVAGCGGGPRMADVEGTVKQQGKALAKVIVEFWPEGNGPRSMATTDDQGHFVLKSDDGKQSGALVGTHRVVLRDGAGVPKFLGRAGDGGGEKGFKPRFSTTYGDPQKTKLIKEVAADKNVIELVVDPL